MRLRPALFACALLAYALPGFAVPVPTQGVRPLPAAGAAGNQALGQGVQALKAGRLEDAKKAFQVALKANPRSVEAQLGLAELAFQARDEAEALRWLQQAEKLDPQRADTQLLLGRFHMLRKQPDKAEPALRKALQLNPKGIAERMLLAELLLQRKAARDALPLLEQVAQLEPQHAPAQYGMGLAQLQLGNAAEAERRLREAARLDPGNVQPLLALARAQPASAEATLAEVLKRQPQNYEALMLLAQRQLQAQDKTAARDNLRKAAAANAKAAEPLVQLAMLDEADGKRSEARRQYLAAVERDPFQPVALNNLVMMGLADQEDPGRLELMARRAVKALPDSAAVHDTLAQTLRARKDKTGALAAGEQAVKLAPKDAAMRLHLAELQQWNGKRDAARQSAEAVLGLQARGPEADKARALLERL